MIKTVLKWFALGLIGALVVNICVGLGYHFLLSRGETVSSPQALFLPADKGKIWTVATSQKRIDPPFPEAQADTVFQSTDAGLSTYETWTQDAAPYASAHTISRYSSYVLELEYKWGTKTFIPRKDIAQDSGIIFHTYQRSLKPWPSGMEFQLKQPNHNGEVVTVRTRGQLVSPDGAPMGRKGKRKGATKTGDRADRQFGWLEYCSDRS